MFQSNNQHPSPMATHSTRCVLHFLPIQLFLILNIFEDMENTIHFLIENSRKFENGSDSAVPTATFFDPLIETKKKSHKYWAISYFAILFHNRSNIPR